jgi:hypothetical protein
MRRLLRDYKLIAFVALTAGCASARSTPVRVLDSQLPAAPVPAFEGEAPESDRAAAAPPTAPRIGAPGGSGAGSRRVRPAQSGNEAVGGLPAGSGSGPRG